MKLSRSLRQAVALATLLSAGHVVAHAAKDLGNLKVEQSVVVTYTDTLEITTAHES